MWRTVLIIISTIIFAAKSQNGPQCDLPVGWHITWFARYNESAANPIVKETFTSDTRTYDVDGESREESQCEQSDTFIDDEEAGIQYNTIVAFKVISDAAQIRYCYDGIMRGNVLIYHSSPQVERFIGYTTQQCEDNLQGASAWRMLVRMEGNSISFSQNGFENPIKDGTYVFTYKNGGDIEECVGAGSTMTVGSGMIMTTSCFTGETTYAKPLNKALRIVGLVTDDELLDLDSSSAISGLCVMAYGDSTAPLDYYFYIARFTLIEDDVTGAERLQLLFTTNDREEPRGYKSVQFIPPEIKNNPDSIIYFYASSTECDASPCQNNGTCTQLWRDFLCTCIDGFSGERCEDDTDNCELAISPCNGKGTCIDEVDAFSCECDPGFGGDFCELRDPCNPNPCKEDAECEALDEEVYVCDCPDGFLGMNCEFFDNCNDDECDNGGTCVARNGGFRCICPIGWSGDTCDEPSTSPPGGSGGAVCRTDDHCQNEGECLDGRCVCPGFWTGALCQVVSQWFIVSIALIVLLVVLLIVILIVCCCCCYGNAGQGEETTNIYATMEAKSLDGLSGPGTMPGGVHFNVLPANSYNNVLTSSR